MVVIFHNTTMISFCFLRCNVLVLVLRSWVLVVKKQVMIASIGATMVVKFEGTR